MEDHQETQAKIKRGAFVVKAKHPWQVKWERYTFTYKDETIAEAEAKARSLIKERCDLGWDCNLLHEVDYMPEEHPASVKLEGEANPHIDMPIKDYLIHSGARYVEVYLALKNGEKPKSIAERLNMSPGSIDDAWKENVYKHIYYNRARENRYDNLDLRKAHREKYLVELKKMIEVGDHDKIPLFFTIVNEDLVKDLAAHNFTTVGDLKAAAQMVNSNPKNWMSNDADYLSFMLDRIAKKDWEEAFWFINYPMKNLLVDPTFAPLKPKNLCSGDENGEV
jgi:hypothetical protein